MLNLSTKTSTGNSGTIVTPRRHLRRKHHVSGNQSIDKPAGFLYSAPPALQTARKRNLLMARRTVLVDDFDESEATQTVQFSYRDRQYAIDLNNEHTEEFDSPPLPLYRGRPEHHPTGSSTIIDPARATEPAQKCPGNRKHSGVGPEPRHEGQRPWPNSPHCAGAI